MNVLELIVEILRLLGFMLVISLLLICFELYLLYKQKKDRDGL
jgi:hypothetical protein